MHNIYMWAPIRRSVEWMRFYLPLIFNTKWSNVRWNKRKKKLLRSVSYVYVSRRHTYFLLPFSCFVCPFIFGQWSVNMTVVILVSNLYIRVHTCACEYVRWRALTQLFLQFVPYKQYWVSICIGIYTHLYIYLP